MADLDALLDGLDPLLLDVLAECLFAGMGPWNQEGLSADAIAGRFPQESPESIRAALAELGLSKLVAVVGDNQVTLTEKGYQAAQKAKLRKIEEPFASREDDPEASAAPRQRFSKGELNRAMKQYAEENKLDLWQNEYLKCSFCPHHDTHGVAKRSTRLCQFCFGMGKRFPT